MEVAPVSNFNSYNYNSSITKTRQQNKFLQNYRLANNNLQSDTVSFGVVSSKVKAKRRVMEFIKEFQYRDMTSKEIDELSNKFRELTKTSKNRLGHRNDVISLLKQYSEYPQADGTTVDKTKELIALANAMQENPVLNYNALAPYLIAVERRYKYPDVETFLTKLEKYPMALKYGTDRIKKLIALLKEKGMTPELQKLIKKAKELEKTPMFSQANLLYLKNEELAEKLTVDNINRYVDIHNKALKSNKYYNSDCCDEFSLYISTLPDDKTKWAKAWDEIEKRLVGV